MVYPPKVWARVAAISPANSRESFAVGRAASFRCGCYVKFDLDIDTRVRSADLRTNGCGYMIASAAALADAIAGCDLGDLHGLDDGALVQAIEDEIGTLPAERRQCAEVCIEALHAAFQNYRSRRIDEFRGEKALICTCFGVTEETIEEFISANRPSSVDDVTAACRAGGGCGSCRMLIQEMLDGIAAYDVRGD